jgi:hypothetical protein
VLDQVRALLPGIQVRLLADRQQAHFYRNVTIFGTALGSVHAPGCQQWSR